MKQYNNQEASNDRVFHVRRFNFNEWKKLYETDPVAFEARRERWIEDIINSSSERCQHRLRGLMFQINTIRSQANNPMQACIEISEMMWNSLNDLRCFLEELKYTVDTGDLLEKRKQNSAVILKFGN
ncbi:DUF3135 domain-containing protein [Aliikangiella coralliicola]|uniref:DUF3135 domain-containing protein n=1 Tax=Aliikangiella coralliicola TaxID=2592383 RepID=UPI00143D5BAB|nr:DUF3135 domain-containing protein [Aliikangiella coralliicola]